MKYNSEPKGTTPQEQQPAGQMYTGRRVLVVEDEPLIAMLVGDWLAELQCEVAGTVNSVQAALQIANASPLHAALLDVNLGGEDSFALADTLIAGQVPVAFITGQDSASLPSRFKHAPVLCKPFDFQAMEILLDRLLSPVAGPTP
jgi:DNA-binding response OmpR family regulator